MSGTLVVTERRQDQVTDFDAIIIGAGISGISRSIACGNLA